MLPLNEGFEKAKSILHEMFGQTHIVAASHIDKVTKGGIIKENENEKLMQLARGMENCGMNLNKLGYQADINSRSNISAVVYCVCRNIFARNGPKKLRILGTKLKNSISRS